MKKWDVTYVYSQKEKPTSEEILTRLLLLRGISTKKDREAFFHPEHPREFTAKRVGIDASSLRAGLKRIQQAIANKESIVIYGDYDADGITATTVMWEALHALGARVMPYIPHRIEEGYGLSLKGIDRVRNEFTPTLIITVDHGITAREQVAYAKSLGIDVLITDHHTKPESVPDTDIIHTTKLSGAGISWFVADQLLHLMNSSYSIYHETEGLAVATIGTVADMMPLVDANRSIVFHGCKAIRATTRVGLQALLSEAGITQDMVRAYDISHVIAPRLNAMGRLVHAIDAVRLLCTKRVEKAKEYASLLGETNKERQLLTVETTDHARVYYLESLNTRKPQQKLIFIAHESYNPGVIGLVAGKLTEEFYLPSIILSKGEVHSKASARSIAGFNIVEAIRTASELLVDVGGHPMAAGFTVLTKHIQLLQDTLERYAETHIQNDMLKRSLHIDCEIPFACIQKDVWNGIQRCAPFGFGNYEPLFASRNIAILEARLVGKEGKHVKLVLGDRESGLVIDAIAFGFGQQYPEFQKKPLIDIAYMIDMNEWNGKKSLQLRVRDIQVVSGS